MEKKRIKSWRACGADALVADNYAKGDNCKLTVAFPTKETG